MQNRQKDKRIYDIGMAFLSLIVVTTVIIELSANLPESISYIFEVVNNIILIVFIIDYVVRLFLAEDKLLFFRNNIIDLIAIIPFNSAFQAVRVLRLSKLLRFTRLFKILKIFRAVAILLKFRKHINKFLKTNNFHHILAITIITLLLGTLGIHFAEEISLGNALWWSFVTITTVGYGDISPSTSIGRIIASILMLVGIGFLSMLTSTISTFFLKKHNTSYKDEAINMIHSQLDNFDELTAEDIKHIYKTLLALKK